MGLKSHSLVPQQIPYKAFFLYTPSSLSLSLLLFLLQEKQTNKQKDFPMQIRICILKTSFRRFSSHLIFLRTCCISDQGPSLFGSVFIWNSFCPSSIRLPPLVLSLKTETARGNKSGPWQNLLSVYILKHIKGLLSWAGAFPSSLGFCSRDCRSISPPKARSLEAPSGSYSNV